jgi:hypothetical protein
LYFYTFRQNGINKTCRHPNRSNANIQNSSIPIVHVWSIQTHHYCSCSAKSYSFLCFLIPWTINNRSIIIDNDKKRSRTHACICFLFLFFQLYTCHLPYVLTYSSISFINSRFRKKQKKNCHRCITSNIQFTHAHAVF